MQVSGKRLALIVTVVAILCIGVGYIVAPKHVFTESPLKPPVKGYLCLVAERFSGTDYLGTDNVIVNIGENQTRDRHGVNATYTNIRWIAVGNATGTLQTKTQLDAQYGNRYSGAYASFKWGVGYAYAGDAAYNVTYKWTFAGTVRLDAASCHWVDSGNNNIYSIANFPNGAQTFNLGENLTVRWVYTFNCND